MKRTNVNKSKKAAMTVRAENIKGEVAQMEEVNNLTIGDLAEQNVPEEKKTMIDYNAAYGLSMLVGRLVIDRCTLDEFDKITSVREIVGKVVQEHQEKLKPIFDEYKIDRLKESHPQFEEIEEKLNALIMEPSSIEASTIQVYQREEIIEMAKEAKVKFDLNELSILLIALKTSDTN